MNVEILEYVDDTRGFRKGLVDIKVVYTEEKSECFRGLCFFEKENRKWLAYPNTKRGDKWLPYYERSPEINKEILSLALKALDDRLGASTLSEPKERYDTPF